MRQVKDKDEAAIRLKIGKSFRQIGYLDRHEQDFGPTYVNRPDLFCYSFTSPTRVIEVKRILSLKRDEAHFDLDQIKDGQRRWMDWATFQMKGYQNIWLGIGTSFNPEQAWLIPWLEWVEWEGTHWERTLSKQVPLSKLENDFGQYQLVAHSDFPKPWKAGLWDLRRHPIGSLAYSLEPLASWDFEPVSLRFEKKENK